MKDTNIVVYNSLTKQKEQFIPYNKPTVNIYTCGPTVYDHSHIGHARSAITWDFIVRFLRHAGFLVNWTRNITDIDDKIIKKATELNLNPDKVARIYTHSFHEDMIALGVNWPDFEPRATQYLSQMIDFINHLVQSKSAYEIDSDVYFSIASFKTYGKLKGQSMEELEKGFGRVEPNPKKKHPLDFALWKGVKNPDEYGFQSPWGKGRPGWHLECSAMNYALYETNLDIHGGGDDLIFPHHENEIAQSEALTNKTFAKYWLHNGMIMVNGKKMAKSEGNFITIKEALKKSTGDALRFFILNSHYRMPLNYTEEGISAAQNGINRLREAVQETDIGNNNSIVLENEAVEEFTNVLSDDFNSPQALSILFRLTDKINTEKDKESKHKAQNTLVHLSKILGFNLTKDITNNNGSIKDEILAKVVENLVKLRTDFKNMKDYTNADKIRDLLSNSKVEVKDLPGNTYKWQIKL